METERHTEEIQDIITKVPAWVIRWGIMIFFAVLLIVAGISAIVRYPDVVKTSIRFQPVEKDALVISAESAVIKQIAIGTNAHVKQGQILALVHTANGNDLNITCPIGGTAGFAAILQPGMVIQSQQTLFVVHPTNQHFFGTMQIPVSGASQIKTGQQVIISLEKGTGTEAKPVSGVISALTNEPDNNGMITAKVTLTATEQTRLESWMVGDAQILTKNISVAQRIWNSIVKKI